MGAGVGVAVEEQLRHGFRGDVDGEPGESLIKVRANEISECNYGRRAAVLIMYWL